MLTFTSDTLGGGKPAAPPCPRCHRAEEVLANLRTERVTFYRCAACGHLWAVKKNATSS